jgi:hypothetical protein
MDDLLLQIMNKVTQEPDKRDGTGGNAKAEQSTTSIAFEPTAEFINQDYLP